MGKRKPPTSQPETGARHGSVVVVAVLVLAATGLLARSLLSERVLLPADMLLLMEPWRTEARDAFPDFRRPQNPMLDPIQQQYPWRSFAAHEIRRGVIPLWNPYMFSGTAFVANLQSSIYYPPNALFYILPVPQAFEWVALAHVLMAGLFTLAYLRTLGLPTIAAGAGAVGFGLCGFIVVWMCFGTPIATLAWMPAGLWLVERLAQRPTPLRAAALAIPVAMCLLAGHGQISLYVLMMTGAYGIVRLVMLWRQVKRGSAMAPDRTAAPRRMLALGLAALAVGAMMAAPQVLPTLEFSTINYRTGAIPYESLQPIKAAQLPALLIPDAFGSPVDGTDELGRQLGLGVNHYIEGAGYAGCVLVALAIIGLVASPRRERWFFLAAATIAVLLAIGSPLNRLTYALVPGMKQMPNIARALCLYCMSIPILGAMGVEALMCAPSEATGRRMRQALLAVGALFGAIALRTWLPIALDSPGLGSQRSILEALGGEEAVSGAGMEILTLVILGALTLAFAGLRLRGKITGSRLAYAMLGLVAADMLAFGARFEPACDPAILTCEMPTLTMAAGKHRVLSIGRPMGEGEDTLRRLSPNVGMAYGVREVRGSESLYTKRYSEVLCFLSLLLPPEPGMPPHAMFASPRSRLLDVLNTKFVLTNSEAAPFRGWRPVEGSSLLLESGRTLGEAFVVPTAESVPDQATALARFADPAFDPARTVLIEGNLGDTPTPTGPARSVPVEAHTNRAIVSAADGPGWLVFSMAGFPGWRCSVDGNEVEPRAAYGAVMATPVGDAAQRVVFSFVPASSVIGWFLGGLALCVLTATIVFVRSEASCAREE